jgi:deazaflavin-dependent oxidoreductase (nitroreductase family)
MPSDAVLKTMNTVHRAILKLSFGHLGHSAWGMGMLELTTTGRKTGQVRSVMLSSPRQEGDAIMIVASRGGDDQHPGWYHNIVANPEVQVSWKGEPVKAMHARVADAAERARLWPLITADHKNYADYQKKTDREIPVVILEPV